MMIMTGENGQSLVSVSLIVADAHKEIAALQAAEGRRWDANGLGGTPATAAATARATATWQQQQQRSWQVHSTLSYCTQLQIF